MKTYNKPTLDETILTSAECDLLKSLSKAIDKYGMTEEALFSMAQFHKENPNGTVQEMVWYVICEWDL